MTNPRVDLKCPECGRFLAEVTGYGRAPCPNCGCEITYASKLARRGDLTGAKSALNLLTKT